MTTSTSINSSPHEPLDTGLNGHYNNHLSEEVRRAIANYECQVVGSHWAATEKFVRASVTSYGPNTAAVARQYLVAVAKFACWVITNLGLDLSDPADVFQVHQIARFVHDDMRDASEHYRYSVSQRLSLLAAHFGDTEVKQFKKSAPDSSKPYSDRQLVQYSSAADAFGITKRGANARVLLGLGAGAGLRAEEIARVRTSDVTTTGNNLFVTVRERFARTVPIRHEWVDVLRQGLESHEPHEWAFTGYRNPGYAARVIHQLGIDSRGGRIPQPTRLRATWIVRHLERGLPVDVLLAIAGLERVVSLDSYVTSIPRRDPRSFDADVIGQVLA